ncbi:MAG: hypothetical protein M5U26_04790 [Planctomycetota bacterium]|nr:hypothetical protein [Planctomycetota bacterium]
MIAARGVLLAAVCVAAAGLHAEEWTRFHAENGLPGDEVQFLREDAAGAVWIGCNAGLARFAQGKLETVYKGPTVYDVVELGAERLCLGTSDGVVLLNKQAKSAGLNGHLVAPVVKLNEETLWAIAKDRRTEQNKLVQSKGGEKWEGVEAYAEKKVVDLFRTRQGRLWVALDGNGLLEVDPAKPEATPKAHLQGENVQTLFETRDGRPWAGLRSGGLRVFDGKQWAVHLPKEKSSIFAIQEDAKGQLWAATSGSGLLQFDGQNWTTHFAEAGYVNVVAAFSDGSVWAFPQDGEGLSAWKDGKWTTVFKSSLPVRCLLETRAGKVWIGGVLDGVHLRN